jgi:uracil-DNA glycosylase
VQAHKPTSHRKKGWEKFTDAIIAKLNERAEPMVFILWGSHAQAKKKLIDTERHAILESAHPSPLSAKNGFFGSKPFSSANRILQSWGQQEIDWCIPADPSAS